MLTEPPGPGMTAAGKLPTVIQGASGVTEVIFSDPPPELTIGRAAVEACGLDARDANESTVTPRLNCGGGAVTVSATVMDCDLPEQADEVHVTVTIPLYGEPVAVRASAALFRVIETTPGVVSITLNSAALALTATGSPYSGMVTVTCTSSACSGKSQSITVALTVTAPPP